MSKSFTPNTPHVVSENFDNETILVSLVNGNYYSLRHTASEIWKALETGHPPESVQASLRNQFDLDDEAATSITSFIGELVQHELIRESDQVAELPEGFVSSEEIFTTPVLEAYSDMQDLLLLDPIHDVDEESGWPTKPAADTGSQG